MKITTLLSFLRYLAVHAANEFKLIFKTKQTAKSM